MEHNKKPSERATTTAWGAFAFRHTSEQAAKTKADENSEKKKDDGKTGVSVVEQNLIDSDSDHKPLRAVIETVTRKNYDNDHNLNDYQVHDNDYQGHYHIYDYDDYENTKQTSYECKYLKQERSHLLHILLNVYQDYDYDYYHEDNKDTSEYMNDQ